MEMNDRIGAAVWSVRSRSALVQVLELEPSSGDAPARRGRGPLCEHELAAMQQKIAAIR